jgi:hypothetical protein
MVENQRDVDALTDLKIFMATDAGASARYQQCRRRRIHINIDDIEPQSKKMSPADRAALESVDWPKKSLLYGDDSQIQALSVMCRHGEHRPNIRIEASG